MILVANIYRLAEMFSLSLSLSRSNLGIVWQECSLLPSRLTKDVIKERLQVEGQVKAAI
jgi:ABC-type ATPase involved in cell division